MAIRWLGRVKDKALCREQIPVDTWGERRIVITIVFVCLNNLSSQSLTIEKYNTSPSVLFTEADVLCITGSQGWIKREVIALYKSMFD